jgi:hypothetical protein
MFAECDLLAEGIDHVDAVYLLLNATVDFISSLFQSGRIPVIRNAYQSSGT